MRHLVAVLVRLAAVGIALTAYTLAVVPLLAEGGDDGLGAGLIAFAALVVAGFVGAWVDARRQGFLVAVGWWVVVAAGLAVGWWIALAVPQDGSASFGELLADGAGSIPFTIGLVAVPALVGAAIGRATGRSAERATA
ncbi:hypothetical protein [Nocardioides zeicaulis]|uniref:Major facilitator superfamily (MFS) profile domain-containing protein n=1 Tax=Nocardioides zeicaulis TaxID=1776857 RepID=A0ABV6DXQ8_9ACTN